MQANGTELTLVECWAPWCDASRRMAPFWAAFAAEHSGAFTYLRRNADECPEFMAEHGVRMLPTLLLLERGRELGRCVGAAWGEDGVRVPG